MLVLRTSLREIVGVRCYAGCLGEGEGKFVMDGYIQGPYGHRLWPPFLILEGCFISVFRCYFLTLGMGARVKVNMSL